MSMTVILMKKGSAALIILHRSRVLKQLNTHFTQNHGSQYNPKLSKCIESGRCECY